MLQDPSLKCQQRHKRANPDLDASSCPAALEISVYIDIFIEENPLLSFRNKLLRVERSNEYGVILHSE